MLARRRATELAQLRRGIRSSRFTAALAAWRGLASTPGAAAGGPHAGRPIELIAGAKVRLVYGRIVRDGSRIASDTPPEPLHELRKRGKELRYLLELFGGAFPNRAVKLLVGAPKDLQGVLARFQDRAVQVETLRAVRDELAAEPGGPAALIALGAALEALLADQRAAREEFAERFARFAGGRRRALGREAFPARAHA